MKCPVCRQLIPGTELVLVPQTRTVARDGRAAIFTKTQFAVLAAINKVRPGGINFDRLMGIVYADDPDGGPSTRVLYHHIRKVRQAIAPLGMDIDSDGGPGSEYRLIIKEVS